MAELIRLPDVAMIALRMRGATAHDLPRVGLSKVVGSDRIVAVGPDEWLVIADDGDADALSARFASFGGCIVDVSGNRIRYSVAGSDALWFLSAGCSLDIAKMAVDDAISTLLARAPAIIVAHSSDHFLILPRRSFGGYVEDWAAAVYG